jgi:6-phosphogluconolactonase
MNTITFPTAQHTVEKIAQEFVIYSQLNHPVHISLSGGSTPKLLFKTLAKTPYAEQINWKNLHFWWGDDRMVPPTNSESNYGEVQKLLFDHIQIPTENIHRIRGENEPHFELKRFEEELSAAIPNGVFDWIILGMGTDTLLLSSLIKPILMTKILPSLQNTLKAVKSAFLKQPNSLNKPNALPIW